MEGTEFVIEIKLAVNFPRALAKKFINWESCWNVVVSRGGKGFSSSGTLTQLRLLLARTILGDFDILLRILLRNR